MRSLSALNLSVKFTWLAVNLLPLSLLVHAMALPSTMFSVLPVMVLE
ncbi:hypothetical protein TUMSATVNIG3_00460 [Vibrio nigripulchritudo]|nr:hypothetical protein TUMSATVNIG2_00460 [Vibrio nigripulchritudo]BDU41248.1 hypothetical protein TUMSATVNIG3_00460 [Vibrio nigripulchritudo]